MSSTESNFIVPMLGSHRKEEKLHGHFKPSLVHVRGRVAGRRGRVPGVRQRGVRAVAAAGRRPVRHDLARPVKGQHKQLYDLGSMEYCLGERSKIIDPTTKML